MIDRNGLVRSFAGALVLLDATACEPQAVAELHTEGILMGEEFQTQIGQILNKM